MMINTATRFSFLLAICFSFMWAQAGEHEPPGPPAPTMVTLQEIYDRVATGPAGVPRTGQVECWDAAGTSTSCEGTGQDGEFQAGVSVSPRFTDNGDGTVKDNLTGLMWLQDANCFGAPDWPTALFNASSLTNGMCGLMDGSVPGDWRLPNLKEFQSLFDFGQVDPALSPGHPFFDVQPVSVPGYWSSTSYAFNPAEAWGVDADTGFIDHGPKIYPGLVWPVRNGR